MKLHHVFFAIMVAAIWGFNFIAVKIGLEEMPPFLYSASRMFICALPFVFIKKPNISWKIIFAYGLSSGIIKFGLIFWGISVGMSAGLASLVIQSQAFFTIILSVLLLNSKVRWNQVLGMVVAFTGMFLIAYNLHEGCSFLGLSMIVIAAISFAASNLIIKRAGNIDMFPFIVWTSLIPPIPMFLLSCILEGPEQLPIMISTMTPLGWSCLLYAACGATLVGGTLWATLFRYYEPSLVAPFSLLIPIFGITFSHILLGEQFTPVIYGSCGLVFIGLVINLWRIRVPAVDPALLENLRKAA